MRVSAMEIANVTKKSGQTVSIRRPDCPFIKVSPLAGFPSSVGPPYRDCMEQSQIKAALASLDALEHAHQTRFKAPVRYYNARVAFHRMVGFEFLRALLVEVQARIALQGEWHDGVL